MIFGTPPAFEAMIESVAELRAAINGSADASRA